MILRSKVRLLAVQYKVDKGAFLGSFLQKRKIYTAHSWPRLFKVQITLSTVGSLSATDRLPTVARQVSLDSVDSLRRMIPIILPQLLIKLVEQFYLVCINTHLNLASSSDTCL